MQKNPSITTDIYYMCNNFAFIVLRLKQAIVR